MSPKVTIIIPAFNAEKFLEGAVSSVKAQTFANWELLIINDGSTDETLTIANRLQKGDDRIRVITQNNKGLSGARNSGIKNARGAYIQFLDADDTLLPTKFERQLEVFQRNPSTDIVFSRGVTIDEQGKRLPATQMPNPPFEIALWERNFIVVNAPLIRRSCLDKIGCFSERKSETYPLYGCEDWAFWLRACVLGANFTCIDEVLVENFQHQSNMSRDAVKMILSELWCLESLSESLSIEHEGLNRLRELSHLYRLLRALSHRELRKDEEALKYLRRDPLLRNSGYLTAKLQRYVLKAPDFLLRGVAQLESKVAYIRLMQELTRLSGGAYLKHVSARF